MMESEYKRSTMSLGDPTWELIDPNPDIRALFLNFNDTFFWGTLSGIEVKWSPRMTLCAGICSYERRGGLCSVRLSIPLLKLRPRKDLIETLLHEMIHAYLFITDNNTDHDGHGPQFCKHMYRINKETGLNISIYHTFHDEVAVYRQHIWQCDGPCRKKPPYFGLVKRSMNRAPGKNDTWWLQHLQSCGGKYTKIKEPEGYNSKKSNKASKGPTPKNDNQDIRKYFSPQKKSSDSSTSGINNINDSISKISFTPFIGKGHTLGSNSSSTKKLKFPHENVKEISNKKPKLFSGNIKDSSSKKTKLNTENKEISSSKNIKSNCDISEIKSSSPVHSLLKNETSSETASSSLETQICYICNKEIINYNNHVKYCNSNKEYKENVGFSACSNIINNDIIVIDDDDILDSYNSAHCSNNTPSLSNIDRHSCPICNEYFTASYIDRHVNEHFS